MRILFMGTPDFAATALGALLDADDLQVAAVATQPDRPAGRGHKRKPSPVKALALSEGLPVLDIARISSEEGLTAVRALGIDAAVTVAYGQILSADFLAIPPKGTINLHASLLPAYRGSAPIQWAIIKGEERTGVTTMYTDVGVDTGDILLQRTLDILPQETAGELFERLADFGAKVLVESLSLLARGEAPRVPQPLQGASHYPMLKKETARIDWSQDARAIVNLIRGTNPWPLAHTRFKETVLRIHRARALPGDGRPGEVVESGATLVVAAGSGLVEIQCLQAPGKKALDAEAFLRGRRIEIGERLGDCS